MSKDNGERAIAEARIICSWIDSHMNQFANCPQSDFIKEKIKKDLECIKRSCTQSTYKWYAHVYKAILDVE
jgi:hypothetical protein